MYEHSESRRNGGIHTFVYILKESMISGARYHRVATYSVIIVGFSSGSALNPLLSPKSQILSSQSALTSKFPGLRSRWTTDAEWMYLIPARINPLR